MSYIRVSGFRVHGGNEYAGDTMAGHLRTNGVPIAAPGSQSDAFADDAIVPGLSVALDNTGAKLLAKLPDDGADKRMSLASGAEFLQYLHEQKRGLARGFDRLLALNGLDLHLFEHQRKAVFRVLRDMRGRALLADEVGLGKTIEAGVLAKEYIVRGLARRLLVLTPASLTAQWHHELQDKLNLSCHIFAPGDRWTDHERLIVSLDTARRPEHAATLQALPWDIVIVDEAHRLKNRHTRSWQLVDGLQKKYMLLLTATPIQNDLEELYNMMTLLRPGLLETYRAFKREFVAERHTAKQEERLRARIGQVIVRTTRATGGLQLPERIVQPIFVPLNGEERRFYEAVFAFARSVFVETKDDAARRPNVLPVLLLLRQLCSSPEAVRATLRTLMTSNTLTADQRRRADELAVEAGTLCGQSSKLAAIANWVEAAGEPCIVFTQFRATQRALAQLLTTVGVHVTSFHGGMNAEERLAAIAAFRNEGGVLICTEAGSEGQNLQFCRIVINCDLPWNPMRVEQRIGRVHRLGQTRDVVIVNVLAPDTMEMHVFRLLHEKINLFEQVIGELDAILVRKSSDGLLPGATFERRLGDIFLNSADDVDIQHRLHELGTNVADRARALDEVAQLNDRLLPGTEGPVHGGETAIGADAEHERRRLGENTGWRGTDPAETSDFVPLTNRILHPLCVDPAFAADTLTDTKRPHPLVVTFRRRLKQLAFIKGRARAVQRRIVHHTLWLFCFRVTYRSDETRERLHTVSVDPLTETVHFAEFPDQFVDVSLDDVVKSYSKPALRRVEHRRNPARTRTDECAHAPYVARRLHDVAQRFVEELIRNEEGVEHVDEAAARLEQDKLRLDQFYEGLEEEALIPVVQQLRQMEIQRTRRQWHRFVVPTSPADADVPSPDESLNTVHEQIDRITSRLGMERRRRLTELAVKYSVRATMQLVGLAQMTVPRIELAYKLIAPVRRDIAFYYDPLRDVFVDIECERCDVALAEVHVDGNGNLFCRGCASITTD